MRILYTICAALLATAMGLVGPAAAEKVCKDYVTATGSAAVLKSGAPKKARAAWSRAVTARYGEFWNDWSKATDANDQSNCGRAYKYLHRCEARARPCAEKASTAAGGYTCSAIGGGRRCEDVIVEVQTKLNDAGCSVGTVDGVYGRGTRKGLRCFQKQKGIKRSGELDLATSKALNLS